MKKTGLSREKWDEWEPYKEHVIEEVHQISDGKDSALSGPTGTVMRKL
jgi:hypothetical protein